MAGDNFRRAVRDERACDAWARMCQELLAMGWGRRVQGIFPTQGLNPCPLHKKKMFKRSEEKGCGF